MAINDTIEPLGGRQTWMQAQMWIAGAAALSLADASHGVHDPLNLAAPLPNPAYNFSVSSTYQTAEVTPGFAATLPQRLYLPRTELGRKLLELRDRGIRSGMKLLTPAQIHDEIARRRGELP